MSDAKFYVNNLPVTWCYMSVRMMVISVGVFGYKIKYAFQMAKCINMEFEALVQEL